MSQQVEHSGWRILVVEDEWTVAIDIADQLEDFGCVVVGPVGRLDEALALAREEPLEGALLDVNLRGEFSYAVADALTARNIPFLFTSGYDPSVHPDRFAGQPVLTKP